MTVYSQRPAAQPYYDLRMTRLRTMVENMAVSRRPIAILDRFWRGKDPRPPTYHISSSLFLRLLGVVYLIAFVSLWVQIDGLVGEHGIVPARDYLDRVEQYFADQDPAKSPSWNVPTLAWINAGDSFLHFLCTAGTVLSVLLILGLFPLPTLVLLWLSYLSLFHVGQVFLSFQWDILLLDSHDGSSALTAVIAVGRGVTAAVAGSGQSSATPRASPPNTARTAQRSVRVCCARPFPRSQRAVLPC